MTKAIANRAAECLKAGLGIADTFKVMRNTYPMASRDELENGITQGIRKHNAGEAGA